MEADHIVVKKRGEGEILIISVSGDVIITNAQPLQREIDERINEGAIKILFDLSKIGYVDSFGIGVLVKTKSVLDKLKGKMAVVANSTFFQLMEKCHMTEYIDVFEDASIEGDEEIIQEALEEFI